MNRTFRPFNLLMPLCAVMLLLSAGCTSTRKVAIAEREIPVAIPGERQTPGSPKTKVVREAYTWVGTPYKSACADKGVGTDCSGFVMKVYQTAEGYTLPRNSAKQAEYCKPVKSGNVQEGDLVFFATGSDPQQVSHVGIMVDAEKFIHASSSKGVTVSNLLNPYFQTRLLMFGRVPQNAAAR